MAEYKNRYSDSNNSYYQQSQRHMWVVGSSIERTFTRPLLGLGAILTGLGVMSSRTGVAVSPVLTDGVSWLHLRGKHVLRDHLEG